MSVFRSRRGLTRRPAQHLTNENGRDNPAVRDLRSKGADHFGAGAAPGADAGGLADPAAGAAALSGCGRLGRSVAASSRGRGSAAPAGAPPAASASSRSRGRFGLRQRHRAVGQRVAGTRSRRRAACRADTPAKVIAVPGTYAARILPRTCSSSSNVQLPLFAFIAGEKLKPPRSLPRSADDVLEIGADAVRPALFEGVAGLALLGGILALATFAWRAAPAAALPAPWRPAAPAPSP